MAKLTFMYGTMASGKSIELMKVAYNYESQNRNVLVLTSQLDNRFSDKNEIVSRTGMRHYATPIGPDTNIQELLANQTMNISAVLIDEAQFLTRKQVAELANIVDYGEVSVWTFGLKNDAFNHMFPGSDELITISDKLVEMKTMCAFCGEKAVMNLRTDGNIPIFEGEQVSIGDSNYYSVCRYHYSETKNTGHLPA